MHCLTSAYFLPIVFEILSTKQKARVLRAHIIVVLQMYSFVGAPKLYITPEHIANNTHAVANRLYGEDAIKHDDIHVPKVIRALWRGNVLSTLKEGGGEQKTPSVNWLYIARTTLNTITISSFLEADDKRNEGKRFYDKRMSGYDQFWENREN
ncbi:hypothetical protein EV175_000678 [Coemansia sp. RSA 1933]|nr:hypothetical protein EV175_000678 [Coemansia sp. RSA 1933]